MYFEAVDLAVTSKCSTFDQKGFKIFLLWNSFFQDMWRVVFQGGVDVVWNFFYTDFTREDLEAELSIPYNLYRSVSGVEMPSVNSIKTALLSLSTHQ